MKTLFNLLCVALFLLSSSTFAQTTYSWVGGTGNWSAATNWSPNGVPTSTDNVFITASGTYTVTLDGDSTINDLTIGGTSGVQTLSLSSRTLTINGSGTINDSGSVSLTSSIITGSGTLTNSGIMTVSNGTFNLNLDNDGFINFTRSSSLNNYLTTQANSAIRISSHYSSNTILTVANDFTNNGLIEFITNFYLNRGTLEITSGILVNAAGGIIQNNAIGSYDSRIFAQINNQGSILLNSSMEINSGNTAHANSGTITIIAGTLTLTQTGTNPNFTNTGTITVDSTATLAMNGGSFDYTSGILTVNGSLSISNATVNYLPVSINTKSISANNSTITTAQDFTNQGNLTVANNSTFTTGPDFTNQGNLTVANSTFTSDSSFTNQGNLTVTISTINGSGALTNEDTITVSDGTINMDLDNAGFINFIRSSSLNNYLTTQANSTIRISSHYSSYGSLTVANGFTNNGIIEFITSFYLNYGTLAITSGTLVNAVGCTIQNTAIGTYASRIHAPVDNQGIMTLNGSMEFNKASAAHVNSGTITANAGTLILTQTGINPGFTNTGTLTVDSTATISVSGGNFDYLPGTFIFNGSFFASNSASIHFSDSFINPIELNISNSTLTCDSSFSNLDALTLSYSTMTCAMGLNNQNTISLVSSTINGSGTLTNSGTMAVSGGTFNMDLDNDGFINFTRSSSLNNYLTTQVNSTIRISSHYSSSTVLTAANGFTNNGLIELITNFYLNRGTLEITSGILVNAIDGIIQNNAIGSYDTRIYAQMDNQGSIMLNSSMEINKTNESHLNSGEIQLNNSTLTFQGNQFENTMTGEIGGNGTLNISNLSFVNNGSFIPGDFPGILSVENDLPSAATALLNFDLGGPIIAEFYNSMAVAQIANFDGTLNINLIDGFVPNVGQEFILATCNTHNGSFLVENGLSINAWKEFELVYEATELKLITRVITGQTSPYAYDDYSTANDGVEIFVDVLYNDIEPNGESLTLVSVGPANNGGTQVGLNNMVSYTPDSSFTGENRFIYTIENVSGCRTSGMVTVIVNPAIPQTPQLAYPADSSMNVPVDVELGWYYSTQIDSYQVQISDVPTFNGGNEILRSGIVDTFVTVNLPPSQDTYYWRVLSENAGGTSAWSVTWNFTTEFINLPPIITSLPDTLAQVDSLYEYQIIATDPGGDTLSYNLLIAPAFLSIDTTTGLIQGTPAPGDVGDHTLSIEVNDGNGGTTNQIFTLHVQPPLGINQFANQIPKEFALKQNYPNPFNPTTTIEYDLPKAAQVKIEIYNLLGKKVKTVLDNYKNAGRYKIVFDSNNLASGVYFYKIKAGAFVQIKKMTLLR